MTCYGSGWVGVEAQMMRNGKEYRLVISKIYENGDQDSWEFPVSAKRAGEMERVWSPEPKE